MTANLCHERFNLLLDYVNFLYLVNSTEKLFCTDFLWSWQSSVNKLLAYLLFNSTYLMLLTSVDNCDRCALLACTASTAGTMRVRGYIIRHSIVDNMGKVINIKSAGSHISSYKKLGKVVAELLHRKVTLLLAKVAMK